jgi:PAS domain S-box-containing protein
MPELVVWLLSGTIIAHLTLGLMVFLYKPGSFLHRLILTLSLSAALWAFAVLMITITEEYGSIVVWIRVSHAVGIMVIWHVYALSISFPIGKIFITKLNIVVFGLCLFLFALSLSPFLIQGLAEPISSKEPLFGPVSILYFTSYIGLVIYSLRKLYRKVVRTRGLQRMQLRFLFGGILSSIVLSSMANVVLPYFNLSELGGLDVRPLGPVFSIAMVGSVSYAIIKYRFMDIRFAIRKNTSTAITSLVLIGLLVVLMRLVKRTGIDLAGLAVEALIIVVVLVVIFTFPLLRELIRKTVDKYLFKKPYDYRTSLIDKVENLSAVLSHDELIVTLVDDIVSDLDLEHGYYYCKINSKVLYSAGCCPVSPDGNYTEPVVPPFNSVILSYVEGNRDILLQSDLKEYWSNEQRNSFEKEMKHMKAEVVVPMLMGSELEGLLFLGAKQSGEPFFKEDIQLLAMLSSQATVALKNARLYQQLLDTKQYLEKIIGNMGNGLITIAGEGYITVFNSEAEAITGILASNALGRDAASVLDPKLYELFSKSLDDRLGKKEEEITLQIGFEKRYLSCDISLIEFSETGKLEVILVLSNVTRIKKLEQEKSQSQRLASLGEMAANIAHEIKNPLVSIKTFAELLPEKYEDNHFRHNFSIVVSQEITRINNLVTEMLNYVKNSELYLEQVKLDLLIDDVLLLLSPQFESGRIKIKKHYDPELPFLTADSSLIKQALINVCVNAVQAMPGGGDLNIGFKAGNGRANLSGSGGMLESQNTHGQEAIEIFIEDNGRGVEESVKNCLFDPFVTSKADGIGLGLSVSQKIVMAHGGRISYKSLIGGGTRFKITLPLK